MASPRIGFCNHEAPSHNLLHCRCKMGGPLRHAIPWCLLFLSLLFSCLHGTVANLFHESQSLESPILEVGEELEWERLFLVDGSSREYRVLGLRESKWYEIKISYPASIPASFDIFLTEKGSLDNRRGGRKLLNTEKLMFYVDEHFRNHDGLGELSARVMVVIHPAGVISKDHTSDQQYIVYNILCEEVIFGIPKQAWWVGLLAVLVLCVSYSISARLPSSMLPAKPIAVKSAKELS